MNDSSDPSGFADVVDLGALSEWMDARQLGSGAIEDAHLLVGGTQNFLLKFARAGRDYVLRRPPRHLRKNSNDTMNREARVLEAIAGSDVPHPGFIASCSDDSVLGACFYLMEPIDGFNATTGLPDYHAKDPAVRHRMGLSMVEGIAALARIDYKAVGLEGFGKPEGFLERQVPRWQSQIESYAELDGWSGPDELPGVEEIPRWLEANRPSDYTPGILHGDYHLANVMFHNDSPELAAIVDWELCTIGDPLLDLGWLMAVWPDEFTDGTVRVEPWEGFPTVDELIAHYAERSDRNLDALPWYGVMACYKLGAILEGSHARACAGLHSKEVGDYLHASTIDLFNRALRMIEA